MDAKSNRTDRRNRTVKDVNIREQKCWQYIREVNSTKQGISDLVALEDCRRKYTYRQMYGMWEQYARVFSALGITGKRHARAAVEGVPCAEAIFAFFGLNMTGASVSMIQLSSEKRLERLKEQIKREHITDIVLTDYDVDEHFLKRVVKEKSSMGLGNVIVLHVPVEGDFAWLWDVLSSRVNYRALKEIPGALFMEDILEKYNDHPISYTDEACHDSAVVIHTSGSVKGVPKPVPLSDRAVNETLRRHTLSGKTAPAEGRMTSMLFNNMFSGATFIGMMTPLANGGKLVVLPMISSGLGFFCAAVHYRLTNIVFFSALLDLLMMIPFKPDLSSVQTVLLVGSFSSADSIKQCRRFFRQCGSHANVLVGYGLSEAGVGLTLSDPKSNDESVGYLLPGVKARLWDEDKACFHDIDGSAHTGVLYISTPSLSGGRLDDEVIFELDEIEGEKYLNTHDLFNVREDGACYYLGRMNKFFVNEEGIRFDAGLIERAVSAQKGIKNCGLAPVFDKKIHDTIPVLYVETTRPGRGGYSIVRNALAQAYITDGLIEKTRLPERCVITDRIPRTETGKVDVHQITDGKVRGSTYKVEGIFEDDELSGIELEPMDDTGFGTACDWLAFRA